MSESDNIYKSPDADLVSESSEENSLRVAALLHQLVQKIQ